MNLQNICAHLVADSVRAVGVLPSWDNLIVPTLQRAGDQWQRRHAGIDVEHVLSDAVTARFLGAPSQYARSAAVIYWEAAYTAQPDQYRSPDCREDGPLDLTPGDGAWP